MNEDFYIGYLPKTSKATAKTIKMFVALCFSLSIALALIFWSAQKPFARGVFEFGNLKEFEGTIEARPVPFLLVEKTEKSNGLPAFERFPLVAEGKRGFEAARFDGRKVKLKGALIYRDELRMIEVTQDSVEMTDGNTNLAAEKPQSLGEFTLSGEIVDSKCYLGVMNPGASKPHRDCAAACLRGGVPPLFIVKDAAGNASELWLTSKTGESVNTEILDFVAEPVEIAGEVERLGDQLFFKIDPRLIERLP